MLSIRRIVCWWRTGVQDFFSNRLTAWAQASLVQGLVNAKGLALSPGNALRTGECGMRITCVRCPPLLTLLLWGSEGRREQCCFVSGTLSLMHLRNCRYLMLTIIENCISDTCARAGITFCSTSISSLTAAGEWATNWDQMPKPDTAKIREDKPHSWETNHWVPHHEETWWAQATTTYLPLQHQLRSTLKQLKNLILGRKKCLFAA